MLGGARIRSNRRISKQANQLSRERQRPEILFFLRIQSIFQRQMSIFFYRLSNLIELRFVLELIWNRIEHGETDQTRAHGTRSCIVFAPCIYLDRSSRTSPRSMKKKSMGLCLVEGTLVAILRYRQVSESEEGLVEISN